MSNRSENLDAVFRDATDPIIIENLDGIVLSLNNEAVRTYGFARDELVGRTIKEIVPRERHDQADDLLRRCRAGEVLRSVEGLRVTKDGRQLPVLLSLSLLSGDDGEPVAIASFAKDISLLRQSEAETKRLSRVFMDAADPIVIEDLSGNVIDLNREAQRAYGWQREQLIGQPIKRIVPEHRYGQADELLQRCLAGGEVRNIEGLRVSRTGEIFDVLITLSLLVDEYAEPMGVASIAKDITSLRQAEAELKSLNRDLEKKVEQRTSELAAAEERSRLLLESTPDAMVIVDGQGTIESVNVETERLLGYRREDLIGQPIEVLVPEEHRQGHPEKRNAVFSNPTHPTLAAEQELVAQRRDGTTIPVEINLNRLKTDEGVLVLAAIRDITERKKAEDAPARVGGTQSPAAGICR